MSITTTVTLGNLIDETLDGLYRLSKRPSNLVVGANALDNDVDTLFTLSAGTLSVTDRIEGGSELMLVTAKSADADPVYTASRGYLGTTLQNHNTGDVLFKNPTYYRDEVERWVRRAISALMNTELPAISTETYAPVTEKQYIELPSNTIDVLRVRHLGLLDGRISDFGGWRFEPDIPTALIASGTALRVPSIVTDEDDLIVTRRIPYEFAGVGEDATVDLPIVGQDIPVLWAVAYGATRREVSSKELEKITEWNEALAIREGVNLRLIRDLWGEVYRRVDEAKRGHLRGTPKYRPYYKMPRRWD